MPKQKKDAAKDPPAGEKTPSRTGTRRPKKKPEDFPVIGIGASAGGLDAFNKFFSEMPADTGMSFVLIQHLDPSHTSNMVEILRRQTRMPVAEATDGMKLAPDHVYMIPPNHNMTVKDRTLYLGAQIERPGISHSIDLFFRSLAEDLKEQAICIILSGTGSDGSLGAKAVKAELGMVMVQEPENANYDGMPRSAIAAGVADFVLPADRMAAQLIQFVEKSHGRRTVRRREVERDTSSLSTILALVRARTKRDFSNYKQSTINRRIERRMGLNQTDNISDYLRLLRENPEEITALVKDFLINVTSFFRDAEAYDAVKQHLKQVLAAKPEGSELRAWVPGCSTGEEAYSVLILIEEALEEENRYYQVQVFGTDLDYDAIQQARRGAYPSSVAPDVGEARLRKFFNRVDDQFQIKRELREKVIFAVQDIIVEPPFTRMDLISARNLLIYFDTNLQKRLIPLFHYALNESGLLFLGTAESVGEYADLFKPLDRRWKIYQTLHVARRPPFTMPNVPDTWRQTANLQRVAPDGATTHLGTRTPERVLLEALPPAVLVDSNYQLTFSHGDTRRYLGLAEGQPNTAILEMAHPDLRVPLSSALQEATTNQAEAVREGVPVKVNNHTARVRITVRPVPGPQNGVTSNHYIITFEELPQKRQRRRGEAAIDSRVVQLEQELQYTKETLRSTIEELETANEELRSANEEYQSTNEELQSTNEELETSREELQSVNEELATVNAEFQAKIEELSTVNDDMKNLVNATGIATIYLNNALRIKRFTPAATGFFNLIPSDVDRPLDHITSRFPESDIPGKAGRVLETLVPVKENVRGKDGLWYSMRILPYRTTDNAIAGVVVTFMDITDLKTARDKD